MNRTNDPGTSDYRSRILRPAGVLVGSMVLLVGAGAALVHFALRPEGREDAAVNVGLTAHGGRDSLNGIGAQSSSSRSSGANASSLTVTEAAEQSGVVGDFPGALNASPDTPSAQIAAVSGRVDRSAADKAYEAGDYATAVALFSELTEQSSNDVYGPYMLGMSEWKSGHADQAEASLVRALDRDPRHVKSLVNLARVRLELGHAKKALVPVARAVEIAPEYVEAHRVHGRVLHNLGVGAQAEMAYVRALAIDPRDGWTLNNLGLLWIEAGEYTEALGPLARAVQAEPKEARIWNNLGVALERAERYGAATEAYTKALEVDSTFARARVSLVRVRPHVIGQSWPNPDLTQLANEFDPSKPLLAAIDCKDEESTGTSAEGEGATESNPIETSAWMGNEWGVTSLSVQSQAVTDAGSGVIRSQSEVLSVSASGTTPDETVPSVLVAPVSDPNKQVEQ